MKITQILFKQHIGWHFKKHWQVQAKKTPMKTEVIDMLKNKGIHLHKPEDFLNEKRFIEKCAKLFLWSL